jgi:hypothetical protein
VPLLFLFLTFLFAILSNQNKKKKKKDKEKDKGIPCVMCVTNDDAIRNGNKHNNVMGKKKKILEERRKTRGKKNYDKIVTIEENKETKHEKKKSK